MMHWNWSFIMSCIGTATIAGIGGSIVIGALSYAMMNMKQFAVLYWKIFEKNKKLKEQLKKYEPEE